MPEGTSPVLRQVVYVSNRPAVLAETLTYVKHFMPWITQAVVMTPDPDAVTAATAGKDVPELVLVRDGDLAKDIPTQHSARNAFLRKTLYAQGPVDDVFLQSDDDYRPLKPVGQDVFLEDGKLVSYAFYDLARWRLNASTYDGVQHNSYLALTYLGAPTLAYASHMPQPIDKALFAQAFAAAEALAPNEPFCEWTLPLNHGRLVAPDRFAEPRTFRTMGWPQHPHEFPYWRRAVDLTFENYYPEQYDKGGMFAGISSALDTRSPEQQAFQKLQRWHQFDLEVGHLRFPDGVANPWVTSFGRRLFFRFAKFWRKVVEYSALEERSQLSELGGKDDPRVR